MTHLFRLIIKELRIFVSLVFNWQLQMVLRNYGFFNSSNFRWQIAVKIEIFLFTHENQDDESYRAIEKDY